MSQSTCRSAGLQGRRWQSSLVVFLAAALTTASATGLYSQEADCTFVRGDVVSAEGQTETVVDLNDAVAIIAYLFINQSIPDCMDAADINDNGLVEVSDYTYIVEFLFNGGPQPPAPFPEAGTDPTPGTSVPGVPDPRFEFKIGTGEGVANNTGIPIPVTLSSEEGISGFTMALQYDPGKIRIDEMLTEENTLLSAESAEYITAEAYNQDGIAYISALKDFATPFHFQDGSDPLFPPGQDQLVATLKCGIPVIADKGFASIQFADGVKAPSTTEPPAPRERIPEIHNLVALGGTTVRPGVVQEGGISIRLGFIRGDANQDDAVDISDPVFVLSHIFMGGPKPSCLDAADANNDTRLDISDSIWLLNYLFKGGPQPSEPFPQPGVDPSDDGRGSLGCESDV